MSFSSISSHFRQGLWIPASTGGNVDPRLPGEALSVCDRLRRTAVEIIGQSELTVTKHGMAHPKILALALLSRTLSNFKGVVLLTEQVSNPIVSSYINHLATLRRPRVTLRVTGTAGGQEAGKTHQRARQGLGGGDPVGKKACGPVN
jgi:hypothetical protein